MSWGALAQVITSRPRPIEFKGRSRVIRTIDEPIINEVRTEVVAHTARRKEIYPFYNPNALSRKHGKSQPAIAQGLDKYSATGRFPKFWSDALITDLQIYLAWREDHKSHGDFAVYYGVDKNVIHRLCKNRPLLRRSAMAIAEAWRDKGPLGMPKS